MIMYNSWIQTVRPLFLASGWYELATFVLTSIQNLLLGAINHLWYRLGQCFLLLLEQIVTNYDLKQHTFVTLQSEM